MRNWGSEKWNNGSVLTHQTTGEQKIQPKGQPWRKALTNGRCLGSRLQADLLQSEESWGWGASTRSTFFNYLEVGLWKRIWTFLFCFKGQLKIKREKRTATIMSVSRSVLSYCDPPDCSPPAPLAAGLSSQEYWQRNCPLMKCAALEAQNSYLTVWGHRTSSYWRNLSITRAWTGWPTLDLIT